MKDDFEPHGGDVGGDGLNGPPLRRLPRRKLPTYESMVLGGLAVSSGLLLGAAVPDLIGADGFIDYIKCAVIAGAGTALSYGTSRLALERGAPLAAIGSKGALLASTASILLVGGGMYGATYAGLVIEDVDRLQLEAYGREMAVAADERASMARKASRIGPAVEAIAEDLAAKAACERSSSCVSGWGSGGEGPMFDALTNEFGRATVVVGQVKLGASAADEALSVAERRARAQAAHALIGQTLCRLNEAAPTTLVGAYAEELGAGGTYDGSPEVARRLNGLLTSQAGQLQSVVASVPQSTRPLPGFPARAGVSDTLAHIGHFLPIAMLIGAIEMVFPLILWLYTYFGLTARLAHAETRVPSPPPPGSKRRGPAKSAKGGGDD